MLPDMIKISSFDFPSELESFVKDVSKFGVVSVTKNHCSTSLVNEVELQAHIPQESKPGVTHNFESGPPKDHFNSNF
jgi:benzoyl-CoA reductase/2-hydroxyglutaryl-CoA dehydratase subunit BcrC/BadD/HgdB